MRIGYAMNLHATAEEAEEVRWDRLAEQARHAEQVGFDIIVLPDHLLYVPGGGGDYARDDVSVGVWESVVIAGALAAATTDIHIGHSMINLPYRPPTLVANIASTLDAVSDGRYSLGIGSGNSFDYAAVGVDADRRHRRFAEGLEIIHGLLKHGRADVDGRQVSARNAELVLRGPRAEGPPIVVAAWGPKTMGLAASYADAWNGFAAPDPDHTDLRASLEQLEQVCADAGRDPATLGLSVDTTGVDPLDLEGGRERTREVLLGLSTLGIDEARCYLTTLDTHASRMEAIAAMSELVDEIHTATG